MDETLYLQEELDSLNRDIQLRIDDADAGNLSNAFEFLKEIGANNYNKIHSKVDIFYT